MKKTLNQEIAEQLIEQLEAGTSPFQKAGFTLPVNPTTGKNYRGMTALQLALTNKEDPRWMTLRQASNAKWQVEKGSKGTMINFQKTQDRVKLVDDEGNVEMNSRNRPKTQLIKLEKPVMVNAFVFNGDQIADIPTLEEFLEERAGRQTQTGAERLGAIVEGLKESMPELDLELPEAMVIQELSQLAATAMEGAELDNPVAVEMRSAFASLMLNNDLALEQVVDPSIDFEAWIDLLKEQPEILDTIVTQAQYIADDVLKLEPKREQQVASREDRTLQVGDKIPYNETTYEVLAKLKKNALQVQAEDTGNKFRVSPGDGIYNSLVQAKQTMLKESQQQQHEQSQEQGQSSSEKVEEKPGLDDEPDLEEEQEAGFEFNMAESEEQTQSTGRRR